MDRIYLSAPHMGGNELDYVKEAFDTNWISSVGANLTAFEQTLEERVGAKTVALSTGTAALHLALRLLEVQPGDEVFCPSLTFAASCNPIVYERAIPVFLDSEASSFNLDPNVLEAALKERAAKNKVPKALVVVHLFGQSADLNPILALAKQYGVRVIEDAAEALGTTYHGKQVGAIADLGIFSFNGNKIITTSGGGALTSSNSAWVEKARFWSTQARDPGIAYEHSELGFNYRMSNILAGIGRGQLEVLDQRVAKRREIAFAYQHAFADIEGFDLMPQASWGLHTNWLTVFLMDPTKLPISRDALVHSLAEENIEARPVWKPMHMQKFYKDAPMFGGAVAEDLYARGICLPSSTNMSEQDFERVVKAIRTRLGARVHTHATNAETVSSIVSSVAAGGE